MQKRLRAFLHKEQPVSSIFSPSKFFIKLHTTLTYTMLHFWVQHACQSSKQFCFSLLLAAASNPARKTRWWHLRLVDIRKNQCQKEQRNSFLSRSSILSLPRWSSKNHKGIFGGLGSSGVVFFVCSYKKATLNLHPHQGSELSSVPTETWNNHCYDMEGTGKGQKHVSFPFNSIFFLILFTHHWAT